MELLLRDQKHLLSKMARNDGHGENSPYFDGWKAYDSDPYHPTLNPNGVIQMGLAENKVYKNIHLCALTLVINKINSKKYSIYNSHNCNVLLHILSAYH